MSCVTPRIDASFLCLCFKKHEVLYILGYGKYMRKGEIYFAITINSICRGRNRTMERGKILIAAGSTFLRVMLTATLEKLGFEVLGFAKNANEAVDKYRSLKPDAVLVDITSDKIDGIEATRLVVKENPSAVVIVLIEQSPDMSEMIVEALKAGAKGYMKKPIAEAEIKKQINRAVVKRNGSGSISR